MASATGEKERSRVLVIGGTGYIGRYIVAASAREGHPTTALVRDPAPADPTKAAVLQGFRDAGVTLVKIRRPSSSPFCFRPPSVVVSPSMLMFMLGQLYVCCSLKNKIKTC
jgi:NAD(P)-dependent dehydrogenase (short-subunit alcohol dehydrogenase family)